MNYSGFLVGGYDVRTMVRGTQSFVKTTITDQSTFTYTADNTQKAIGAGYWGSDLVVGSNGKVYYYGQGATGSKPEIRWGERQLSHRFG